MKLLALETATEACSAALWLDGEVRERSAVQPRGHSELILGMLDELLIEAGLRLADMDGLAFGRGPGSFTGVRIATGVVQGVAFAADLPVVPVSTLAALAQRAFRERNERHVLAAFDARMGEVYWGAYEIGGEDLAVLLGVEEVAPPAEVAVPPGGGWYGAGSGWSAYREQLVSRLGPALRGCDPTLLTSAHDVAALGVAGLLRGGGVPAERALPVYLRDRVAAKPSG